MGQTTMSDELAPLWSDERINEYIKTVLIDQPNHTPRGLVRRVSYAVRDDYEAERRQLHARIAQLEQELGIEQRYGEGLELIIESLEGE